MAKLERSKEIQRVFASLALAKGNGHKQQVTSSIHGYSVRCSAKQKEYDMPMNKNTHKVFQEAYGPKATENNL